MKRGGPKHNDREQTLPVADIMTLREVAEYLGCSKFTVYNLVKHGEFPAFRLGRDWRLRRSDIDKWIAQLQEQQQAPQAGVTASKRGGGRR